MPSALSGGEECARARGLLCLVGLLLLGISASLQIIMKSKPIDNVLGLHAVHKLSGDVKATFDTIVSRASSPRARARARARAGTWTAVERGRTSRCPRVTKHIA